MSRTLWRVRPRGERPTTVAKPKENLIANCPLLNHYLGARWPSTTCRRISVLSLAQTAHSRLAVACARCFPPPCQGGPRVCRCPPTRADPGQAVTLIPRRVLFSGVPRRRSTATCGHDVGQAGRVRMAPCASRSGAANLHRRGEHPQAARRRRRGQGFHIHRLRHTAAVRWLRSEAPKPAYARTPGGRPTDASLARSTPPSTTSFRASRPKRPPNVRNALRRQFVTVTRWACGVGESRISLCQSIIDFGYGLAYASTVLAE